MGLRQVSEVTGVASFFNSLIDREAQGGTKRVAFELSCSRWRANNIPSISMSMNPQSVSFDQAKRTTERNTIGGKCFFHWADSKGRNLDLLKLTLSGETGALSGLGKNAGTQRETTTFKLGNAPDPRAQLNARNWARFYALTADPQTDPDTYQQNVFEITYKSLLIPYVKFFGFFTTVLKFTDDAQNPFSKKWNVAFTVTGTDPDLTQLNTQGNPIALMGQVDASQTQASSATSPEEGL